MSSSRRYPIAVVLVMSLQGCGVTVPPVNEPLLDMPIKATEDLEYKVKYKLYCELQAAVSAINDPAKTTPYRDTFEGRTRSVKPLPDTWGVQMTIQFIVEENATLSPGAMLNTPLIPGKAFGSAVAQSFNLGLGGTLSSDATRTDKFSFYYLVPDLEGDQPACRDVPPKDLSGSSLLLQSDLRIDAWLRNAMNIRSSVGNSRPVQQQEVMTYDVKFDVLTNGAVTPTWHLVRVATGNGAANLFGVKRERTHELILTFGPSQIPKEKGGKAQPSVIAANDALAQQIGSAVGKAVQTVLSQQ